LLSNSFSTLTTNITSNSKRSIQLTEDRQASMSQQPQAHDEDGMVADPTVVQDANAQEFLESLRLLYARQADLDALLNSEVFEFGDEELGSDSDLLKDFDLFAAALSATSQQTHDEELIVVADPNMVLWQDDDIQVLLRSLREENTLVNAVYDTEEAVWSDSGSDEIVAHFPTAPALAATAAKVASDLDLDTVMTDVPLTPAFVMPPLLPPTLPDIVEKELLRPQQTSKVLGTLAPLESELIRLKISDEQEDEERRRKNTCLECGLLCVGMVKLGDHGVEEHGWVVISMEDCEDDERVLDSDDKESH
jgi:hypothetical protein